MPRKTKPSKLMPIDWPHLSDAAATEISDFLNEVAYCFDGHYLAQILRFRLRRQQFEMKVHPPAKQWPDDDEQF